MVLDAASAEPAEDSIALTVDVKSPHKLLRLRDSEHGLVLFEFCGILYHYVGCHFGGSFSDYWWGRMGAFLHRLLHRVVFVKHAGHLFVDDWLWRFPRSVAPTLASLVVMLLVACGCPLCWRKFQFSSDVEWIGLLWRFQISGVQVPENKVERPTTFLTLASSLDHKFSRNEFERGIGLLMYLSEVLHQIRPWLAAFYHNLHGRTVTFVLASQSQLVQIVDSLDDLCQTKTDIHAVHLEKGTQILRIGKQAVRTVADAEGSSVGPRGTAWVQVGKSQAKHFRSTRET